jgi:plasmid stabilization system protein ParE
MQSINIPNSHAKLQSTEGLSSLDEQHAEFLCLGQIARGLEDLKMGRVITDDAHWLKWHARRSHGAPRRHARLRLLWSAAAEDDIRAISQGATAKDAFAEIDQIEAVVLLVRTHPRKGLPGRVRKTREIPAAYASFIIVYRTAFRECIEIVRVVRASCALRAGEAHLANRVPVA